ncbi:hypothetical protein D3C80_1749280 [compost metagenome]
MNIHRPGRRRLVRVTGQVEGPVILTVGQPLQAGVRLLQPDTRDQQLFAQQCQRRNAGFDALQLDHAVARDIFRVTQYHIFGMNSRPGHPGTPATYIFIIA